MTKNISGRFKKRPEYRRQRLILHKSIVHAGFLPSFKGINIINNVIQGMCERVPDKISRSGKI